MGREGQEEVTIGVCVILENLQIPMGSSEHGYLLVGLELALG